jgi:PAS domain S-box-containing protein
MNLSEKAREDLSPELENLRARVAELEKRASEREGRFQSLFDEMTEGFALHEIICDENGEPCDYRFLEINPAFERLTGLTKSDVIGRTVRQILPETESFWVKTFGAVALTSQPIHFENYSAALKRHYECFAYCPAPRQFAVLFTDITGRKKTEKTLRNALVDARTRERHITALLGASRAVREEPSFSDAARRIFDVCCEVTGATSGYVALLSEDGQENEVLFLESGGLPCNVDPALPMPIRGLRAQAYKTGKVVYDNNFAESPWMRFMPEGHVALRNVMFAPMNLQDKTVGLLGLANKSEDFTDDDASVAGSLAEIAAVALQRARDEEARRDTENRYKSLAENVPSILMRYDRNLRVVYLSKAAEEVTGVPSDEVIGKTNREAGMPKRLCVLWDDAIREVFRTGRNKDLEVDFPLKDGSKTFYLRLAPEFDREGEVQHVLGVSTDITERKRTEKAILRAKEEWELTFDAVPDLMAVLDTQHRIVRVNKAMATRLGVTPKQCIGQSCHEAVHGQPQPPQFCPHALTCQDGKEHRAEVHEPRLGGDFLVSTTPLLDGQGKLIGSIHVARDITERKQAEDKVKRSLREKEVLLKEIHHRVKNNLQIIHSMLNLQMSHVTDEQAAALFKESQSRVFSMALIHEKLYQSPSLARIDLPDYVKKITANLFQSYGVSERTIMPKIEVEDVSLDLNTVIPCALIINELVSNSLKYAFPNAQAEGEKGEIRIELRRETADKLRLTVGDNGIGLPAGFDMRKSKTLGLQLVSVLAKQLNGSVQIATGGGTTFKIVFEAVK